MGENKVKEYRTQLKLTQEELALRIGITRQTLSLIELNKYNPSLKLCILLCKELKCTLNDLFWEEEIDEIF